jgi:hypothetical protein
MSFMLAALRVLHIDIPGARPWLAVVPHEVANTSRWNHAVDT